MKIDLKHIEIRINLIAIPSKYSSLDALYNLIYFESDTSNFTTVSIPIQPNTFDIESVSLDIVSEGIDNDSEAINLMYEVIDNDSKVIDLVSEVLDTCYEVIDKNFNRINTRSDLAHNRSHPFAVRHICCLHEANPANQRQQKSLPSRPALPHLARASHLLSN